MISNTMPLLSLGTAQFGLDYGITNRSGKLHLDVVKTILDQATLGGVTFLDTAQAYGNSEKVIGAFLPDPTTYRICSKLPSQINNHPWDSRIVLQWQDSFELTLDSLGVDHLDSFLLHNADDLHQRHGGQLLEWLKSLQRSGLVRRIGVSIYQESDLDGLPLHDLQIVQLPCSLYDQRLISNGTVYRLRDSGLSLHARSLFLQGLLLIGSCNWPSRFSSSFRAHHHQLEQFALSENQSLLDLSLGWAKCQQWMEAAVIGVTSPKELQALLAAWNGPYPWKSVDCDRWAWKDPEDLDPRCWN